MTIRYRTLCALLACILASVLTSRADDLKAYYEQQKAEIAPTFKAPELGSDITVTLASGKKRNGILMKLTNTEVSLMTDAGSVVYKTTALHETSRVQLFADAFAHTKALERL